MSGGTHYSYVNNNPLSFTDHSGFDLDPITVNATLGGPENPIADVASGIVGILDLGDVFGWFGGGGPALSPMQQAGEAHGLNLQNALQGAPTYQTTGGVSVATEAANSTVPMRGVVAGADAALTRLRGGSIIESAYEYFVPHAPGWGPGQSYPTPNVPCADSQSNCYDFTDDGYIPENDWDKNTFGFNRMLTVGSGDCWVQSGACSRFFDQIPGLQSVSQLHDTWMNMLPSSFNFISMPFAAGLSYGALVGGSYYLAPMLNVGRH